MPLVAQAAGVEVNRKTRIRLLRRQAGGRHNEAGAPGRRGKASLCIEPGQPLRGTFWVWPLLWALRIQNGIREPANIEIAALGGANVLPEYGLNFCVGEELQGLRAVELYRQPACKVTGDAPVWPRFGGCRNRLPYVGDAPLRVGDGAFLLGPGACRQHEVGVSGCLCGGKGFLQHHELAAFQCLANECLVWHGVCWVGTGDPQRAHLASANGLEEINGSEPRFFRNAGDAPKCSDLGAVLRVCQIAMAGEQVGHATDFAPAHCIRLPRQRERPAARPADLADGQRQGNQCRAIVRAVV